MNRLVPRGIAIVMLTSGLVVAGCSSDAGQTPLAEAATECGVERQLLDDGTYIIMTEGQDNIEPQDLSCVLFGLDAPFEVLDSFIVESTGQAEWEGYEARWSGSIYSRRLSISMTEP